MIERACVGGIVIRGQELLLGKRAADRAFFPGVWDVFGGGCEPRELPEATLVRELQEELGIIATEWTLLTHIQDPELARYGITSYDIYIVTGWRGIPANLQPHEHSEIRWFPIDHACRLALAHPAYPRLFQQLRHPANGF